MESGIKYGGWILALLLLGLSAYLYVQVVELNSQESNSEFSAAAALADAAERARLSDAAATANEEAESLRQELAGVRRELAALREVAAPAEEELPTAGEMESAEPDGGPPEPGPPESGENRVANAQMAIMAGMTYQELFEELELSPEMRDYMKEVIGGHMRAAQEVTMTAMRAQNEPAKEVHARIEQLERELRAELAGTLTPEELAAWDEYEPVADQILYERLVEGQLNMMASGLEHENRLLASQIMAEELVREIDAFNRSEETYSMANFNSAQARALNASLAWLGEEMEADQYGQVEGFVNQAIAMFETMAEQ